MTYRSRYYRLGPGGHRPRTRVDDDGRRYYVTTLIGFSQDDPPTRGSRAHAPAIYMVHDRDDCHKVIAVFDEASASGTKRRKKAQRHAYRLNEEESAA